MNQNNKVFNILSFLIPSIIILIGIGFYLRNFLLQPPIEKCLSGRLVLSENLPVGGSPSDELYPDKCLAAIIKDKKEKDSFDEEGVEKWCNGLSESKKVFASNIEFAEYASYKDYCLHYIGKKTLEPSPLLKVVSERNNIPAFEGTLYPSQFKLPVNYFSLNEMVPMIKSNTNINIDPLISDKNFVTETRAGKEEVMELISFNVMYSETRALEEVERLGYRPANINEFLSFVWNNYKVLQDVKIVALAPSSQLIEGFRKVPRFSWINGVPTIDLKNEQSLIEEGEYSLILKK